MSKTFAKPAIPTNYLFGGGGKASFQFAELTQTTELLLTLLLSTFAIKYSMLDGFMSFFFPTCPPHC